MIAPAQPLPQVVRFVPGPMIEIHGLLSVQRAWVQKFLTVQSAPAYGTRFGREIDHDRLVGHAPGPDDSLLIAPGALQGVCRGLRAQWPGVRIAGVSSWPDYPSAEFPYSGQAREYQACAMIAVRNYPRGLIVGPCGSGKGDIALQAIQFHGMRALIIVDTDALRDDWYDRILDKTGIQAWRFGNGRKARPENPFCIATYQGLRRNLAALEELGRTRGTQIVDEVHVAVASTFLHVLRFLPAKRRYGFTATPHNEHGLTNLMYWWIGPEIAMIERAPLEDAGRIMRPSLEIITTNFTYTYNPDDVRDENNLKEAMIADAGRLDVIVTDILRRMPNRYAGLVECNSIRYGYAIRAEMIRRGYPESRVACVNRTTKKSERKKIFAAVDSGDVSVLITTSLAEKGLNILKLDTDWKVTPKGSAVRTEQGWGRIAREAPGKQKPLIIEVVDPHVTRVVEDPDGGTRLLRKYVSQFRRRFAAYESACDYDRTEIRKVLRGDFG